MISMINISEVISALLPNKPVIRLVYIRNEKTEVYIIYKLLIQNQI
jgi:hypothetical protein